MSAAEVALRLNSLAFVRQRLPESLKEVHRRWNPYSTVPRGVECAVFVDSLLDVSILGISGGQDETTLPLLLPHLLNALLLRRPCSALVASESMPSSSTKVMPPSLPAADNTAPLPPLLMPFVAGGDAKARHCGQRNGRIHCSQGDCADASRCLRSSSSSSHRQRPCRTRCTMTLQEPRRTRTLPNSDGCALLEELLPTIVCCVVLLRSWCSSTCGRMSLGASTGGASRRRDLPLSSTEWTVSSAT